MTTTKTVSAHGYRTEPEWFTDQAHSGGGDRDEGRDQVVVVKSGTTTFGANVMATTGDQRVAVAKDTPGPYIKSDYGCWEVWSSTVHGHRLATFTRKDYAASFFSTVRLNPVLAAAPDLLKTLIAASHALRSYQYGNASTELAQEIADAADIAIAAATKSQKGKAA
jgi:hypothetical protein